MGDIVRSILSCASKSLSRKRLRTLLTISSITVGVTMVVIVTMISSAGKKAVSSELENLGLTGLSISTDTVSKTGNYGITRDGLKLIRTTKNVISAMPLMIAYDTSLLRATQDSTLICGIDSGANQAISLTLKYGRMISKTDVASENFVCVVDKTLAKAAYGRENITGKTIILQLKGSTEEFRIIGVAETGSTLIQSLGSFIPSMVYIPYSTMQMLTGRDTFDQVAVRVSGKANVSETEKTILDKLQKLSGLTNYYKADNLTQQRERLGNLMNIVTIILTVISGISLVVSGLGIMTIMLVSVNERMREIGVKKAIGATRQRILLEFLTEAVIIALLGSLSGILIGSILSLIGTAIFGLQVPIRFIDFTYLIGFSVLVGAVFGVYPAIKASRLKPVDALRME